MTTTESDLREALGHAQDRIKWLEGANAALSAMILVMLRRSPKFTPPAYQRPKVYYFGSARDGEGR